MKGFNKYKIESAKLAEERGYILIHEKTGHRQFLDSYDEWSSIKNKFNSSFWENYRNNHKGTGSVVEQEVKWYFKKRSSYHRSALNSVTQGGGAIVTKKASTILFNWIVNNGYFNIIKLLNITHDEINTEFPKELENTYPQLVATIMKEAGDLFYDTVPLTASYSVGNHWIH